MPRDAADFAVAVGDETATGMRTLAQLGTAGAKRGRAVGAPPTRPGGDADRAAVGADAVALLPLTEGVTDPDGYAAHRVGA